MLWAVLYFVVVWSFSQLFFRWKNLFLREIECLILENVLSNSQSGIFLEVFVSVDCGDLKKGSTL